MRAAVERGLQENWAQLFGYAVALAGSREAASDLLQTGAERALAGAASLRDADSLRPWLFRIIRNLWIDGSRRDTRQECEPLDENIEGQPWSFEDGLIAAITVRQGLSRISVPHREMIELIDIAGFGYAEAAAILEVPPGTVMSRISRARLALLEAIEGANVRPLQSARRSR